MALWKRFAIFIAAATMTCVFFINFCNAVFGCGCTWLWAGAAEHCNIHSGVKHCPWCVMSPRGQGSIWLSMVIPQGIIAFRSKFAVLPRLIAAIAAFPVMGLVAAAITGIWYGYWN